MTLEEVLKETIRILNDICVPVGLTMQITVPVSNAISNLNECIKAIETGKEETQENQQEKESIDVDVLDLNGNKE